MLYALLITAAMAADLITFALIVPHVGIQDELNPIMRAGYIYYGLWIVVALKITVTVTIILLVERVERPTKRMLAAILGISLGLLGLVGNINAAINAGVI